MLRIYRLRFESEAVRAQFPCFSPSLFGMVNGMGKGGNMGKPICGNPVFTPALYPGIMNGFLPSTGSRFTESETSAEAKLTYSACNNYAKDIALLASFHEEPQGLSLHYVTNLTNKCY